MCKEIKILIESGEENELREIARAISQRLAEFKNAREKSAARSTVGKYYRCRSQLWMPNGGAGQYVQVLSSIKDQVNVRRFNSSMDGSIHILPSDKISADELLPNRFVEISKEEFETARKHVLESVKLIV
jgi:hypothetical protein